MGYQKLFVATMTSLLVALGGCISAGTGSIAATTQRANSAPSTVFILNGADGPGPWYNSLVDGLCKGGAADRVEMVNWGVPWLFLPNLLSVTLHGSAENHLMKKILEARQASPQGHITLVGHSAGCGVILGTLKRLPEGQYVDTVILLAPAVSKGYDLAPSLAHVSGSTHVFYSEHDQMLLKYSTALTSTYDHVFSRSAGLNGFEKMDDLTRDEQDRLVQHAYKPEWRKLGHGGGHFGYRSTLFAAQVLAPLAQQ